MTKRNPFKTLERIGNIVGGVIFAIAVVLAFSVVGFAVADYYGWGWWALLLIPGIPIALVLLAIVAGLTRLAADTIHDAWLMAKWRWDDRHPADEIDVIE